MMTPRRNSPYFLLSVLLASLLGCGGGERGEPAAPRSRAPAADTAASAGSDTIAADDGVVIRVGGIAVQVRIGETPEEKSQGLKFVEDLPEDQGMLFVFQHEEQLAFWMKDTPIALDIAFIDRRGRIVDIQRMEPLDEAVHMSRIPAMYALEMNAGWFQKNGVKVGDVVEF
jgi:uncharacterized membrane protein (UPF0127 family)